MSAPFTNFCAFWVAILLHNFPDAIGCRLNRLHITGNDRYFYQVVLAPHIHQIATGYR